MIALSTEILKKKTLCRKNPVFCLFTNLNTHYWAGNECGLIPPLNLHVKFEICLKSDTVKKIFDIIKYFKAQTETSSIISKDKALPE